MTGYDDLLYVTDPPPEPSTYPERLAARLNRPVDEAIDAARGLDDAPKEED